MISALFYKTSIDYTPLGDIISTLCTLVQGLGDGTDITFTHSLPGGTVSLSTAEMREVLCGVPLSTPEVLVFMKEDLVSQYEEAKYNLYIKIQTERKTSNEIIGRTC